MKKQTDKGKKIRKIQALAVFVFVILIAVLAIINKDIFRAENISEYAPKHKLLAAMILIFLFALKSITVVVPIISLYIASGILFPPFWAVIVSSLGTIAALTVPYIVGRISGSDTVEAMRMKYPKFDAIAAFQNKNLLFACFITRIVVLPADLISFYFGTCKAKPAVYFAGAFAGCLPGMMMETLIGDKVTDLKSTEFLILIIIRIAAALVSVLATIIISNRRKTKE